MAPIIFLKCNYIEKGYICFYAECGAKTIEYLGLVSTLHTLTGHKDQ